MELNPFIYPRALEPHEMVGRKKDLQYILGRLAGRQSVAIIGRPHTGKTCLRALEDETMRRRLAGAQLDHVVFSYADAQALRGIQTQAAFWVQVLRPLTLTFALPLTIPNGNDRESHLLEILKAQFNEGELRELCLTLAVNYDGLPGSGTDDKARELLLYHQRRQGLELLVAAMQSARPHNQLSPQPTAVTANISTLQGVYETAVANNFSAFVLEQLFRQLHADGRRLVLLLDEFDDFLANPALHTAEFYGGLRSLVSRSPGLVLVIATRRELETLIHLTQQINPHGSPYFNVFTERNLGPLSQRAFADLLNQAGARFNREDRRFVADLSGAHPYLAQAAAAALWEADDQGRQSEARYRLASDTFYTQCKTHFRDTWDLMTEAERKAVTAVALLQLPSLVPGRTFYVNRLAAHLEDYTPELERLARGGLVQQRPSGDWVVPQTGFLWWLADVMWRTVRDETTFDAWLQRQAMDGLFTRGERAWMSEAAKNVAQIYRQGDINFGGCSDTYTRGLKLITESNLAECHFP